MISSAISQSGTAVRAADTEAAPSGQVDWEIVNRFGICVATAGEETLARATALRLSKQFSGLRVERVERIERREVIYRPRGIAS